MPCLSKHHGAMKSTNALCLRAQRESGLLGLLFCCAVAHPQAVIDLDSNPQFDFAGSSGADPLFAPETIGLTAGMTGFDQAAGFYSFAVESAVAFPPSHELFIAFWAEPRYALLSDPVGSAAALAPTGPFGLTSAFSGGNPMPNVVSGRGLAWQGEAVQAKVGGVPFEIPGAQSYVSPLVLDVDGDGVLGASRGLWSPHPAKLTGPYAAFDIDGDGFKDVTEWVTPGDGLLVTTPNPTSGRDMLGTVGGWADGFAHLRSVCDHDQDGRIEGSELGALYLWKDGNGNGVADPGEVSNLQAAGIVSIIAKPESDLISSFRRSDGSNGLVWDWWPNYALANRRSTTGPSPGHPILGHDLIQAIRIGGFSEETLPVDTAGLTRPVHISREQLRTAGIDVATFQIALLADNGRALIGYDSAALRDGSSRTRLLQIRPEQSLAAEFEVVAVVLPFEELFQLACSPYGHIVLALGNQGATLAMVDFNSRTVVPSEGLSLRSIGIRASGVAGNARVRYSGTGNFWFSGWQLNEQGEVMDESVWAVTPWGFWRGLSLDSIRHDLGQVRSHFVTGPMSGFFVVPDPAGTGQQLWSVAGAERVLVDTADSFGGLHAIGAAANPESPFAGPSGSRHGSVAYAKRNADGYSLAFWQPGAEVAVIENSQTPLFYPLLTDGGGSVMAVKMDLMDRQTDWEVWTTQNLRKFDHIGCFAGQGKATRGALACYSPSGIDIFPVPDIVSQPPPAPGWNYNVLAGSKLIDICPVCGRPPLMAPLEGTFSLRLIEQNPLFSTYAVENIELLAGTPQGQTYKIRGKGVYHVGGEVGLMQDMYVEAWIDNGSANMLCSFTNSTFIVKRGWPIIQIVLDQSNGTDIQQYQLDFAAAPVREVFFSTAHGFTPGVQPAPAKYVRAGDLVSDAGRVVAWNHELARNLGLMPSPEPADLGLDAVDILPKGEIAFSIENDVFSETLGFLHNGDILSDQGRVVRAYNGLIDQFAPMPPVTDMGLDALQVLDSGEICFSVETDFFSQRLGVLVRRGDLLSSQGRIVKTQEQLLSRFHPPPIPKDFGLDAIYVWPGGEVWFSLEDGFEDGVLGWVKHGDLLSDQGELLYSNYDLLRNFQPLEDLADFGLDAVYIVSDAITPTTSTASCTEILVNRETGAVGLRWEATGRLRQLEKAPSVLGPWTPVGPLTTDLVFTDTEAPGQFPQAFYRLREW